MMVLPQNTISSPHKNNADYQEIFQNLQILISENTEVHHLPTYLKGFSNILFYDLDFGYAVYAHQIREGISLKSAIQKSDDIKYIVFLKNALPYTINIKPTAPDTIKPSKQCLLYLWKYYKKEYEWITKHPEQLCNITLSELSLMETYIEQLNKENMLDSYMSNNFYKIFAWHYWPEQKVLKDLMLDLWVC